MTDQSPLLAVSWAQDLISAQGWIWPVCEMIHYVGVALIVGLIGALDLRILGMFKRVPIGALRPLVPLAIAGFVANLLTGIVFISGSEAGAQFYLQSLSFRLKMVALFVAFANLMYFQMSGLEKRVYAVPAGADAPTSAKWVALISLVSWVAAIIFGRLLMYNDSLLYSLGL